MNQHHHRGGPRSQARRALSQNFLSDPAAVARYARAAVPAPDALVVEAGAGDGRVTAALAARAGSVIAYEIDPRLAARLRARCAALANVRCVTGDFLAARPPSGPFHLAGNIPFASTSRIVGWALTAPGLASATLITQLEYARKRTGGYGRWSRLTVRTWPEFGWEMGGRVPRGLFRPVPRVDGAVLRLTRRARPLLPPEAMGDYLRCVDLGFTGRGGTLRASLCLRHPRRRVDAALRAAGIAPGALVADAHPDQWVTLVGVLHGIGGGAGAGSGGGPGLRPRH
ncbi:ErmE/ErmH/ErmO/ErmR family 23S rRNA (adenine(2058)-N(6))-methyltransferase [Actinomadura napierensis]|uniref:ErmE/ErmH/ErmO/ErmR family 23S rRNA (adenine(2058)-N(6))-methyltransferase n=1 Tax=Actinomadura napierensis TaxID=267854 RepID=UPI00387E9698